MNTEALKTLTGALYHNVRAYGQAELSGRDYELFCSHLHIDVDTIYCLEVYDGGLRFLTRHLSLTYSHHELHHERVIEISDTSTKEYYEAFGSDVEILRNVLRKHHIEFEEVEHTGTSGTKSVRFYMDALNDDVTSELEKL